MSEITADTITADTITDEQIKALWGDCPNLLMDLMNALGLEAGPCFRKPTADEVRSARARCADILNARKSTP